MQFLTQTKWPVPVAIGLVVLLFVAENQKWLTAEQVTWVMGLLAVGGTQTGVHTDKPEPPAPPTTTHITIPPKDQS